MKQLHSYSTYNLLAHSCFMTMCDYMTRYTRCIMTTISISINPNRSVLFQTANDPGGGGGFKSHQALKAPPPPQRSRKLLCQSSLYHTCAFYQVFSHCSNWNFSKIRDFDHFIAISK